MLTFTLAISCLTTSNLPWFMDLTFQVPMQYCSLQHWTLLLSPVTSTTGCCFPFGFVSSFFSGVIALLFSSSILGTYWPGEFIFQRHIFLPFYTVHEVLKARILKWFAIPFSMDHVLSELSTMTRPSWVALHSMAHSFISCIISKFIFVLGKTFLFVKFPLGKWKLTLLGDYIIFRNLWYFFLSICITLG